MKLLITILIFLTSLTSHSQQNTYLKQFLDCKLNKDEFLIKQKWSGVDSVRGLVYNPYIYNKKEGFANWVWKTDFSGYLDTQKYYVKYSTTGGTYGTPLVEWLEISTNGIIIRTVAFCYSPETNLLSGVLDSDLD